MYASVPSVQDLHINDDGAAVGMVVGRLEWGIDVGRIDVAV